MSNPVIVALDVSNAETALKLAVLFGSLIGSYTGAFWLRYARQSRLTSEILFFLGFAAWAFVRASNPNMDTSGGEKTMELALINAIMHSPTFPPHDPWLSGYAISYYYFGYFIVASLIKLTGVEPSVGYNLAEQRHGLYSENTNLGAPTGTLADGRPETVRKVLARGHRSGSLQVNGQEHLPGNSIPSRPVFALLPR